VLAKQAQSHRGKQLRQNVVQWLEWLTMELKAGKSLSSATRDLAISLSAERSGDLDSVTVSGWRHCLGMIQLRYPVGEIYRELAGRLGLQELRLLSAVVGTSVLTGANLPKVFVQCASGLREQLESKEALEAMLAARRLEGIMLSGAPAVYTALLKLSTPAYMAPLYSNSGWIVALVIFGLQLFGCHLFFRMLIKDEAGQSDLEIAGFQEEIALHLRAGLSLPDAWRRAADHRVDDQSIAPVHADSSKSNQSSKSSKSSKSSRSSQSSKSSQCSQSGSGISEYLAFVARQLEMGVAFGKALDRLIQKGGVPQELMRMVELLRRNYRLGGGSLAVILSLEAGEARQKCLHNRKAKDGKRETTLLFPMILLLLSALMLTAAPALMSVG
jgi:tight adherence protein B